MLIGLVAGMGVCTLGAALLCARAVHAGAPVTPPTTIEVPQNYREWIYLTSGMDMTYTATTSQELPPNHDGQFDNVFVNPESYRAFQKSGAWPNKTVFVLENRAGKRNVSINKGGRTQGEEITGIELHMKNNGQWTFYVRKPDGMEHLVAKPASCYTCHEAHAAVDTTFVQFYPTLLPIAQAKHLFSPSYLAEASATEVH